VWRRRYGCSKYFETSFGSWRTRYWCNTLDEYQKYFEKDKALERRFQKIIIEEPDTESAISILRGIKGKYETHHKVQIKRSDYRRGRIITTVYYQSFSRQSY
jgi:hypothetical protein